MQSWSKLNLHLPLATEYANLRLAFRNVYTLSNILHYCIEKKLCSVGISKINGSEFDMFYILSQTVHFNKSYQKSSFSLQKQESSVI